MTAWVTHSYPRQLLENAVFFKLAVLRNPDTATMGWFTKMYAANLVLQSSQLLIYQCSRSSQLCSTTCLSPTLDQLGERPPCSHHARNRCHVGMYIHIQVLRQKIPTTNTDLPANARDLLGMSCPSSERQHAPALSTLSCTLRVCADRGHVTVCKYILGKGRHSIQICSSCSVLCDYSCHFS